MACLWTWHALSTCPVDMFAVFILRAKQIRQCDSVGGVKPSATLEPFGFRTRHEPFSIITVMTLSCNNRIHIIQSCTIHSQLAAKDQKLPKKNLSRRELRTETQSWRSSGSASVLLTSSSNLDSGWLQQAKTLSTFQDTLLTPKGDGEQAKRSKGLLAKFAKGSGRSFPKGSHKKPKGHRKEGEVLKRC